MKHFNYNLWRQCLLFFIVAINSFLISCDNDSSAQQVRDALQNYNSPNQQRRAQAQRVISHAGNDALGPIRDVLRSKNGLHISALQALVDIGSEKSYSVLIEALDERTHVKARYVAPFVGLFIHTNNWSAERARNTCDAGKIVLELLKKDPESRMLLTLVHIMNLRDALPQLTRMLDNPAYTVRRYAATIIYKVSGEVVNIRPANERFTGKQLEPDLFHRDSLFVVGDWPIAAACLIGHGATDRVIAVASKDPEEHDTRLCLCTCDGQIFKETMLMGQVEGLMAYSDCFPSGMSRIVVVTNDTCHGGQHRLVILTHSLEELCSIDLNADETIESMCWLYDKGGRATGILLGYRLPGQSGNKAIDLSGQLLWDVPLSAEPYLSSNPCATEMVLRSGGGIGWATLMDVSAQPITESALPRCVESPGLTTIGPSDRRIAQYCVVGTRERSQPVVVIVNHDMTYLWDCELDCMPIGLGTLYSSCGKEGRFVIVVLCDNGKLLAIDEGGVFRWCQKFSDDPAVMFKEPQLDVLYESVGNAATFIIYWDNIITMWHWKGE